MHDTDWDDDTDKIEYQDIDIFVHKIKKMRTRCPDSPIIVHCSAGLGRTGTLIAIYALVESIEWQEKEENKEMMKKMEWVDKEYKDLNEVRVSVFACVRKMREQRWSMVKKQCQYNLIYGYLQKWVKGNFDEMLKSDDESVSMDDDEDFQREINEKDDQS